jgi:hypothetical protein
LRIKIVIQNKFYIEYKNSFSKRPLKNQKNEYQISKINILLFWIEWWNWKQIKLTKDPRKKIEIKKIRTKLENIIYCNLRLKDEIENK